ncbi:1-acyl-sn-glycerol-3-phosphate acyltransferase (plasmid) [Pedobacter sp. BS3]|uniref:lysophospholipid acyltransferase family protein n=1 Tax=Pedobacter sp. BS3 TaxID=2567937 RepID=UPI0011EC8257|nr:lysophospholipid acyltransferase family protein [Pedobacter sp. BS3]TZF85684.1 1-acyl-sn-glycerol-3-phosphate acyltransferase [Pedobacter sp. BS3]
MHKALGYIFTPIHYIVFGLALVVFHPIQWICLKLGGYRAHKWSVDWLNFFLVATYYLLGSSIRFINRYQLPVGRPIIFIANHQSMYDIPPLIWFLRKYNAKFISKIELTRGIPSISFNLKHGGGANIDRKDSKQAISEIIKLAKRMKENKWSAVIFPEGTRSRDGEIKPFAVGGVATLLKKVPEALVVPIAIKNSWRLVQYGFYPLSFGEKMTWQVLQPIEPDNRPAEEVIMQAEQAVREELKNN